MHTMAKPQDDPTYIKQRLEKAKYKTGGRIGTNVARIRAEGETTTGEGVVAKHELHLELEKRDGGWHPVPPSGDDFTSAPSILKTESNGCYTRAYIRHGEDLQRILIRLGAIPAPKIDQTTVRRGWRPKRPTPVVADNSGKTKPSGAKKTGAGSGRTKKPAKTQAKRSGAKRPADKRTKTRTTTKTNKSGRRVAKRRARTRKNRLGR